MNRSVPISLALAFAFALSGCLEPDDDGTAQDSGADNPRLQALRAVTLQGHVTPIEFTGHLTLPTTLVAAQVPTVPNGEQTARHPFTVTNSTLLLNFSVDWTPGSPSAMRPDLSDIDLYIYNPMGQRVGSAASLDKPEKGQLFLDIAAGGEWTAEVVNYLSAPVDYALKLELVE